MFGGVIGEPGELGQRKPPSTQMKQFNRKEHKEPKEKQTRWRQFTITNRVEVRFASNSLLCDPCVLCG